MADIHKKTMQITYGRLNKALTELGFVRKSTDEFTAYREATHDALIVLPNRRSNTNVGDPHLVTIWNTITGKGVASADRLQTLLANSRSHTYAIKARQQRKGKASAVKSRKPKPKRTLA